MPVRHWCPRSATLFLVLGSWPALVAGDVVRSSPEVTAAQLEDDELNPPVRRELELGGRGIPVVGFKVDRAPWFTSQDENVLARQGARFDALSGTVIASGAYPLDGSWVLDRPAVSETLSLNESRIHPVDQPTGSTLDSGSVAPEPTVLTLMLLGIPVLVRRRGRRTSRR